MTRLVHKVQLSFNKASVSYDRVAKLQRRAAAFLVDQIGQISSLDLKTVLDLGTGTGCVPELLFPRYPKSIYYLNDIADQMLEVCKVKFAPYPNIHYLPGHMMEVNVPRVDLVISNLALQWVEDWSSALRFFHAQSAQVFAFSTLLEGTFQEWEEMLGRGRPFKFHQYPCAEALSTFCKHLKREDQSFQQWQWEVPLVFDSPRAFMLYLRDLGASPASCAIPLNPLLHLLRQPPQPFTVSYKLFFGIFSNPSV